VVEGRYAGEAGSAPGTGQTSAESLTGSQPGPVAGEQALRLVLSSDPVGDGGAGLQGILIASAGQAGAGASPTSASATPETALGGGSQPLFVAATLSGTGTIPAWAPMSQSSGQVPFYRLGGFGQQRTGLDQAGPAQNALLPSPEAASGQWTVPGMHESKVRLLLSNTPPVAVADSYNGPHDQTVNVSSLGVLGNDTDADLDTLSADLVTDVSHGSLSRSTDGGFSYTPTTGNVGTDTFQYRAFDGTDYSNTVTVTIDVTDIAPIADDDAYDLAGSMLTIGSPGVLQNDTDPDNDTLTAELVDDAAHGSVGLGANGNFSYTAGSGFTGVDSFTYRVFDGGLYSNTATVTITGHAPTAVDDAYGLGTWPLTVSSPGVLENDTDPDHDTLTAELVVDAAHGDLSFHSDGNFTYTPDSTFTGTDSFTYRAFDGALYSAPATVTIVAPVITIAATQAATSEPGSAAKLSEDVTFAKEIEAAITKSP
jgi:VCBS repeat-containing protein